MSTPAEAPLPAVTRVGAYAVCLDGGRVLLTRITADGRWTLPGGGVDEALARLAAERGA